MTKLWRVTVTVSEEVEVEADTQEDAELIALEDFDPTANEPHVLESYEIEQEDDICSACNGSGEGMYDGSTCYKCRGRGIEPPEKTDDDI